MEHTNHLTYLVRDAKKNILEKQQGENIGPLLTHQKTQ